jgi:hypothetical protein
MTLGTTATTAVTAVAEEMAAAAVEDVEVAAEDAATEVDKDYCFTIRKAITRSPSVNSTK